MDKKSKIYTPEELARLVLKRTYDLASESDLFKTNTAHEVESGSEPKNDEAECPEELASDESASSDNKKKKKKEGEEEDADPEHEKGMSEEEEKEHDAAENEADEKDEDKIEADEEKKMGKSEKGIVKLKNFISKRNS